MLIQIFIFNKYYEILDKNITKFDDFLKEIGLFIFSLNDNDFNKGFWKILEDNHDKLELLDILTDIRGYKKEFPISNIFNYLYNSAIFFIKYKSNIFCQLCNLNIVE